MRKQMTGWMTCGTLRTYGTRAAFASLPTTHHKHASVACITVVLLLHKNTRPKLSSTKLARLKADHISIYAAAAGRWVDILHKSLYQAHPNDRSINKDFHLARACMKPQIDITAAADTAALALQSPHRDFIQVSILRLYMSFHDKQHLLCASSICFVQEVQHAALQHTHQVISQPQG